jgi:hypothetical protein
LCRITVQGGSWLRRDLPLVRVSSTLLVLVALTLRASCHARRGGVRSPRRPLAVLRAGAVRRFRHYVRGRPVATISSALAAVELENSTLGNVLPTRGNVLPYPRPGVQGLGVFQGELPLSGRALQPALSVNRSVDYCQNYQKNQVLLPGLVTPLRFTCKQSILIAHSAGLEPATF